MLSVRPPSRVACGILLAALMSLPSAAAAHDSTKQASRLTAFGATRKGWAAHHVADPNPKLLRGCCFLPKQNDGQDRYYAVQYEKGRVVSYEMDFGPRVRAPIARLLMKREVPPDARIIARTIRQTCEQTEYRSATLKRVLGSARVGDEFSSDEVGGPYRGIVRNVIIAQYVSVKLGC
jgi:hypothetical protein